MSPLYPMLFHPILKEKIWGGQKLNTVLHKDLHQIDQCGEAWELSAVTGNVSEVRNGPLKGKSLTQLIDSYGADLVGSAVWEQYGNEFPLLVKFLDANQDLSIQVHPDDELAQARHQCAGKTEMWYVLEVDPGSRLIAGFNQSLDSGQYLKHLKSHTLNEILNYEEVFADDVFYIPAGRVHTIGKGILLAEIQQTSDITYRIYDFDRVDKDGNKRELHVEQALEAIDFQHYPEYKTNYDRKENQVVSLVKNQYFQVNRLYFNQSAQRSYQHLDTFVIYVCVEGRLRIHWNGQHITLGIGETALLPACIKEVELTPLAPYKVLEAYIP